MVTQMHTTWRPSQMHRAIRVVAAAILTCAATTTTTTRAGLADDATTTAATTPPATNAATRPASAPAFVWRTAGTEFVRNLDLAHFTPGDGMRAAAAPRDMLRLGLKDVAYSDVELADRIDYTERGVVRLDLSQVKGGAVSLQAVALGDAGKVLSNVDLLEYIEQPGTFEVPLRIYRTPLKGARQIAFRIWFAGSNTSSATVAAISYGVVR
jgi:hypothetical protein